VQQQLGFRREIWGVQLWHLLSRWPTWCFRQQIRQYWCPKQHVWHYSTINMDKIKCSKEGHKKFGSPVRCNVTYIWRHPCQERKFILNSISSKSYENTPISPYAHVSILQCWRLLPLSLSITTQWLTQSQLQSNKD